MLQFEKPIYKITDTIESNFYGRFELEPLERGFGTTIGNALRRVMLSSLPGSAVSSVRVDGILHEFQTLDGVYEDIMTIILNLKGVVFKNYSNETKVVHLNIDKEGVINTLQIILALVTLPIGFAISFLLSVYKNKKELVNQNQLEKVITEVKEEDNNNQEEELEQ